MPRKKDDILLKSAFEELFPDLLRFYFKEADAWFDMDREFEFLDKELCELFPELERNGGNRFVDMLVKTFLRNGKEEWVLIHIEIQQARTKDFPHRMFQYWYRIYDRYGANIAALAVFTGSESQKRPDNFHREFLGTSITYKYKVYHILDHSETELLSMDNPFALVVLAAQKALLAGKIPEEELGEQRLTLARAMITSGRYDHKQIARFLYFIKSFLHIENQEINLTFDKEIDLLLNRKNTMGIIEAIKQITREEAWEEGLREGIEEGRERGIEKGREEEKIAIVKKLLAFTDFDDAFIASLMEVSISFVEQTRKEMNK